MADNTPSPPSSSPSPTALNTTIMERDVYPALINAVSAWTPLLGRASAAQLDRFAAYLAPLAGALGGRLGSDDAEEAEEERAALAAQNERIKNDWIDLHHALEDARDELAERQEEVAELEDEVWRLRGARRRVQREAEARYEEGLRARREVCARGGRIAELEREVRALRAQQEQQQAGGGDAGPVGGDEVDEQHLLPPQHAAAAAAAAANDDDEPAPRYALRGTKRRRLDAAGEKPRVRAAFAMLLHGLDDAAAADDNRFFLDVDDLADRQQVHAVLADPDADTPAPPAAPVFAEARALLLARLQLRADDGPVYVDMLPAHDPVVGVMEAAITDLVAGEEKDDGGKAAENRARRAMRWAEGRAGVDYCLGGALRTRRKPNFVDGPQRACKECVSGRRPCLVREAGSGELVALPWKGAPEEATWKDVVMWKGDGAVARSAAAGAAGGKKGKRRT